MPYQGNSAFNNVSTGQHIKNALINAFYQYKANGGGYDYDEVDYFDVEYHYYTDKKYKKKEVTHKAKVKSEYVAIRQRDNKEYNYSSKKEYEGMFKNGKGERRKNNKLEKKYIQQSKKSSKQVSLKRK